MLGNFTYENPMRVHFGKEEDIEKYCDATFITTTGYYTLTREDVAGIFRKSL